MPGPVTLALPGDGKEAVAILLCGRRDGDRRHRLTVREVQGVPYELCPVRTPMQVTWPPDYIAPMLERAAAEGLSLVKVHSHPTGYAAFSRTDDEGDARLLPMIRGWVEADIPHGSAVMLPNGQMFGRVLRHRTAFEPIECVSIAGNDLHFWYADAGNVVFPDFTASHLQAFDEGTIQRHGRLSTAGSFRPIVRSSWKKHCRELKRRTLYVVQEDGFREQAAMLCPCGCSRVLHMNLLPDARPCWRLTQHEDGTASLHPSVWRKRDCGSHFWFRRGRVQWCGGTFQ